MKRAIILVLILTGGFYASAQDACFSLNLETNPGITNLVFFKQYAEAYNSALGPELNKELGKMKWSYGYSYGFTIVSNSLYLEFENNRSYTSTHAEQINPALGDRYFKARHHTKSIILGLSLPSSSGDFMTLGYFFGIGEIHVDSYKKYPSGDISYGSENNTNGKYVGKNLTMGLKLGYQASITDRLYTSFGVRLGFSLPYFMEQRVRELNADHGLNFPGMVWPEGLPSMIRTGTFTLGIKYLIVNDI